MVVCIDTLGCEWQLTLINLRAQWLTGWLAGWLTGRRVFRNCISRSRFANRDSTASESHLAIGGRNCVRVCVSLIRAFPSGCVRARVRLQLGCLPRQLPSPQTAHKMSLQSRLSSSSLARSGLLQPPPGTPTRRAPPTGCRPGASVRPAHMVAAPNHRLRSLKRASRSCQFSLRLGAQTSAGPPDSGWPA